MGLLAGHRLKMKLPGEPAVFKEEGVSLWDIMLAYSTFVVEGETEAQRCEPVCQVITRYWQRMVLREHKILVDL